jgi:hypothetical protein
MLDVESVIDQFPHSENSLPFVTFSLRSKLCSASCLFICRTTEEGHDKDYKGMATSVNNRSECNRNSHKLMIIMIMMM